MKSKFTRPSMLNIAILGAAACGFFVIFVLPKPQLVTPKSVISPSASPAKEAHKEFASEAPKRQLSDSVREKYWDDPSLDPEILEKAFAPPKASVTLAKKLKLDDEKPPITYEEAKELKRRLDSGELVEW